MRASGIIGLNQEAYTKGGIIFNLKDQGHIKYGIMGLYLNAKANFGGSEAHFGGYNEGLIGNKTIHWANVVHNMHWVIILDSVMIGMSHNLLHKYQSAVLIDSGTSYLLIPKGIYIYIYIGDFNMIALIMATLFDCGYVNQFFYCETNSTSLEAFPPISMVMGGHTFTLTPSDYITFLPNNNTNKEGKYYAVFKILVSELIDIWIMGDNFMNNYYTIFDFEKRKIGFVG